MSIAPTLSEPAWVGLIASVAAVLSGLAVLAYNVARLVNQVRGLEEKVNAQISGNLTLQGGVTVRSDELAQHQVAVGFSLHLLTHPSDQPYLACQLDLTNSGPRPTDLVACLVAGREIHQPQFTGLGREGREVEWDALRTSYWNVPGALFHGLSTTGNLFKSRSQLVRLDPGEREELLRLDAVADPELLAQEHELHLIYKLFIAVRPALPGTPLSNEHHRRWRSIQYTLSNLNRFPFRLALAGSEKSPGELLSGDPLGLVASQTGWRCFLLHHWDFEELHGKGPEGADDPFGQARRGGNVPTLSQVSAEIQQRFGVYDPATSTPEALEKAAAYAASELTLLVEAWRGLLATYRRASERGVGWGGLIAQKPWLDRWQTLAQEGYLFRPAEESSPPQPARDRLDPFAQERFAVRTKYVLRRVTVPLG